MENELSEAEALERIQSLMSGATTMDEDGDPVLTIRVPAEAVRELRGADEESDENDTDSESSRSRRAFPGQSEEEQR